MSSEPTRGRRKRSPESDILTDGQWHHLHPVTPLLRGGVAFIVILGIVIANFRERLVAMFVPAFQGTDDYDPVTLMLNSPYLLLILGIVLAGLLLLFVFFYVSWRMGTFRITGDAVEMRSGILMRRHRQAKLDRIQSVNIVRPFLARLLGAAKVEVSVAGENSNVSLEYVYGRDAEPLRRDLLTLASGVKLAEREAAAAAAGTGAAGGRLENLVNSRVNDLLAPELNAQELQATSVVRIPAGRVILSTIVSLATVFAVAALVFVITQVVQGRYWALFPLLPVLIGVGGYYWSKISKSLRYSVASTPSGIRVGSGLLSTSNDTVPPGRVHAVRVTQPLLWRPFGWWQVQINRAGTSVQDMANGGTTILQVGKLDDAAAVVGLLLNQPYYQPVRRLLGDALGDPARAGFILSPRRAAWLNPLSWSRTGYTVTGDLLIFRRGLVWRHLDLVPLARTQSVRMTQGPIERRLRVASVLVQTVLGPVTPALPHMAASDTVDLFERVSAATVVAMNADETHRWASARAAGPVPGAPRLDLGQWTPSAEQEVALAADGPATGDGAAARYPGVAAPRPAAPAPSPEAVHPPLNPAIPGDDARFRAPSADPGEGR